MKADDPAPPPSTQQPQDERPIIVHSPEARTEPPRDSTERSVNEYIARIDDLSRQVADSGEPRPADSGAPRSVHRSSPEDPAGRSGAAEPSPGRLQSSTPAAPSDGAARKPGADEAPGEAAARGGTSEPDRQPATTQPLQTASAASDTAGAASPAERHTDATEAQSTPPPPRLVGVSVRAMHAPPPTAESDATAPAINAPVRAALGGASPGDLLENWLSGTEPATFRDELDRRLIQVVAGDYETARQPIEAASEDQQALAAGLTEALVAVREGHLGDPAKAAAAALDAIEGAAETLRAQRDLEIPIIAICREVIGYGQYTPIEPASFPAGIESEFVIYCEVRNFQSRRDTDGLFQTRFSMRTTLLSRAGDTVLETEDPSILDRCRNRRRDCFIPRLIRVPATLSPGEYVAKVTLVDKLGEKVAENRATFRVSALTP